MDNQLLFFNNRTPNKVKEVDCMAIATLPVDQRVIDIDSRRFSSVEKALVELITNSDDSYVRLEKMGGAGDRPHSR